MTSAVFDDNVRTDRTHGRHGEGWFTFLNRSATAYFGLVRDLIEEWFSHVPAADQPGMRGSLRADGAHGESAFWELYLHEAYRRSGYRIDIHPEVPERRTRPDFLMTRGDERFYVEAVSVGRAPTDIAQDARLSEVHRVLTEMLTVDFGLALSTYGVGDRPLSTRRLRTELQSWLGTLDVDVVSTEAAASEGAGFGRLPELLWEDAGWSLEFHAIPRAPHARERPLPALGVMGAGEATVVDNATGIRRVLDEKRGRYGHLDAPLVIAVQSNTEYPTHDYEAENALFGVGSRRPLARAQGEGFLLEEGFWLGTMGWRNASTPQVVTIYGLSPWRVTSLQPRVWSTLEPNLVMPMQPDWLAPMHVGDQSLPGAATPMAEHLGLPNDWPGPGDPDFDLS